MALLPGDIPGGHIQREAVELMCQKAQRLCGIAKPITPHSMRHAFAVHRLTTWYKEGKDVQKLLPQLSVYMGHRKLAHTSTYLTMTPELLHQASQLFEQYALKGGSQ